MFKYNPNNYPYPLNESMETVYNAKNTNDRLLAVYIADTLICIKQAIRARMLSQADGEKMKEYFWGLQYD